MPHQQYGSLYIVGLGPGDSMALSPEALDCLEQSDVLVGYSGYISLLSPALRQEKHLIATGMMGEVERAEAAVDAALQGRNTCVVCSGDAGIYALAGLILEIVEQRNIPVTRFPVRVIPGIPALCAAAALLGAPLMHDFACISLSDLLTPWETICTRLACAFQGNFVVVLYNPKSKKRIIQLDAALALALEVLPETTPVGIVRNAYRPGQEVCITRLDSVPVERIDMFSLVIIGNSHTRIVEAPGQDPLSWQQGARMLTPRGYASKYSLT